MPRCPVCQNRYVHNKNNHCPCCDWDLQNYSFPWALVPDIIEKENTKLTWAKQMWSAFKSTQEQLQQAIAQLEKEKQAVSFIKSEFEQSRQQQAMLADTLYTQQARFKLLKEQLAQSHHEMTQQRSHLNGVREEQSHNLQTLVLDNSCKVALELQEFSFGVVTISHEGQPTHYRTSKALHFQEDLGKGVLLDMVYIPGGTFLMGSPDNEPGRESYEEPQHQKSIQPFYLSRFPITQAQWKTIAQLPQIHRYLNPEPSHFNHPDFPVEKVSWHDTVEFCARLTELLQRNYRLPSEAEWEFACRAQTTTPFHFGETITSNLANYDGSYTYGGETQGLYRQRTTFVENFQVANAFGLIDLHGNVWEWCADSWHDNYHNAPFDGKAWQSDEADNRRVLRGGAWYCLPHLCRSAQRHWDDADNGGSGTGFRVACFVN